MTKDEIIEMAKRAGFEEHQAKFDTRFEPFAKLVAEKEREACAKLVEPNEEHRRDASWGYFGGEEGVQLLDATAANIRARGQA